MDQTGLLTSITFVVDVERVRERKQRAAAAILNLPLIMVHRLFGCIIKRV